MNIYRTIPLAAAIALLGTSASAQSVFLSCTKSSEGGDALAVKDANAICSCVARSLKDASMTRKEEALLMREFDGEAAGKIIDRVPGLKASTEKCMHQGTLANRRSR